MVLRVDRLYRRKISLQLKGLFRNRFALKGLINERLTFHLNRSPVKQEY